MVGGLLQSSLVPVFCVEQYDVVKSAVADMLNSATATAARRGKVDAIPRSIVTEV